MAERGKEWNASKQRVRVRQDRTSRAERAFSFLFVAGSLENLFRELDVALADDIRLIALRPRDLRISSLSMLTPGAWEKVSIDRVTRMSRRRALIDAFSGFYASDDCLDFSAISSLGLVDGRTVDVHHFEAIWEGLSLSPTGASVWISQQHRIAVSGLAQKRNAIAHFETDPRDEAFRYSYQDLAEMVTRIKELIEQIEEHTIIWLDKHSI